MKADMTVTPAYSARCTVLAVLVGAVHGRDPSRHGTCCARFFGTRCLPAAPGPSGGCMECQVVTLSRSGLSPVPARRRHQHGRGGATSTAARSSTCQPASSCARCTPWQRRTCTCTCVCKQLCWYCFQANHYHYPCLSTYVLFLARWLWLNQWWLSPSLISITNVLNMGSRINNSAYYN